MPASSALDLGCLCSSFLFACCNLIGFGKKSILFFLLFYIEFCTIVNAEEASNSKTSTDLKEEFAEVVENESEQTDTAN